MPSDRGIFFAFKKMEIVQQRKKTMKENKSISIGVRISEVQAELLDKLIKDGKAKNRSGAIHYLINEKLILGESK